MVIGRLATRLGSWRRTTDGEPVVAPAVVRAGALGAAGWPLPRSAVGEPRWICLGTIGSDAGAAVDAAGVISPGGWSLDWWIGAEDRWHQPTVEPSVRQTLLGGAPAAETAMRVPGGDAVHRACAVRGADGRDLVVVEVENRSHVPFAVALVIAPFDLVGGGAIDEISIEPVDAAGRDAPHVVRVDGRPALYLPRRPAGWLVRDGSGVEVDEIVAAGTTGDELAAVRSSDGTATGVAVFPLAHTSVLRVLVPIGEPSLPEAPMPAVPPLDSVVAGWDAQDRGARLVVPDQRLAAALVASRRHLLLAATGLGAGGAVRPDEEVTPLVSGALADLDRSDLVGPPPEGAEQAPPPRLDVTRYPAAALAEATRLRRSSDQGAVSAAIEHLAAAAEVLGRDVRRRRAPDPRAASLVAADGVEDLAALLVDQQPDAAAALLGLVGALRERGLAASARSAISDAAAPPSARRRLVEAGLAARNGDGVRAFDLLAGVLDDSTDTWTWPAPPESGPVAAAGHDRAANAALVRTVRSLLVRDEPGGLALLPVFTDAWYGGGVEVHDLPTDWGRLSYAIRWHGQRPAILWDLEPRPGRGAAPRLTVPGLDPSWFATDLRGEALLAEVAPPVDLDPLRVVAEHPDADPAMRRPGRAPDAPGARRPDAGDPGGSFS